MYIFFQITRNTFSKVINAYIMHEHFNHGRTLEILSKMVSNISLVSIFFSIGYVVFASSLIKVSL